MESSGVGYKPLKSVYRPGLSSIDRLKKTVVGQQEIIAGILTVLEESADKYSPDNTLFVGPRGIGKTHLLKLLADKIARSRSLMNQYVLITFPVDNHGITSLPLLLLKIIKQLKESTNDKHWEKLLVVCQKSNDDTIQQRVTKSLKEYYQDKGRRFLILFENFDAFFVDQKKNKEIIDGFAGFLSQCDTATFIGTAAMANGNNTSYKIPPFNLFNVHPLFELNLEQTQELIFKHLKYDQQTDLLQGFGNLASKIQALHQFTGGNPRLILLLYKLLTDEDSQGIKSLFEELLDRVTPFYQERMLSLSAIDRSLLATLASLETRYNTNTSLTRELRISAKQCHLSTSRLLDHGHLTTSIHPKNRRSKIFHIKEGFFDLWLAIGQLEDPKRFLPFLGEFLKKWYSSKTGREKKRQQLWHSLQISEANGNTSHIDNVESMLNYLANIGSEEEQCQNQLELCYHYASIGKAQTVKNMLKSVRAIMPESSTYEWVSSNIEQIRKDGLIKDHKELLSDLFDCWKLQRTETFDQLVPQAIKVTTRFEENGYHQLNIAFLEDTIKLLKNVSHRLLLYVRIAGSQEKEELLNDAIATWNKVLKITDETGDLKSKGTTLNNISQIFQDQENYSAALDYLEKALEILKRINDFDGQSTTLNNIATVYYTQGYYEKALEYFEQTLSIVQHTSDFPLKAITLSNISFIYKVRGEFLTAINCLEQSLSIMRKIGNSSGEAKTLINISQVYEELGDLERCDEFFQLSLQIMQENQAYEDACDALLSMGKAFWKDNNHEMALSNWSLLKKLALENHLPDNLEKLRELTQSLGIDELKFVTEIG
ncbi:MAG: ATP-binding protein [Deltaproteobacteria bacterium]|jgi:tetratricopeptide (TPR) repeat protein|nr:ATP-binding protein [Deltaproteobacteria bacterium]MBT4089956.1 ATP-binding protein [Deltaproteobacteria bacterium]MBT4264866.1 ATP-binding protein [Deltaproteobacteria bacterium]MBT4640048.1 ATP-binding protein [Deltaproteobacteria bacterium]MBT7153179.1 ATP-binding protein [Deltaproteobacteria bacterium]